MNSLSLIEQDNRADLSRSSVTGTYGESLAADFLQGIGYRIVMTNFRAPVGRNSKGVQVTGEIDIVALEGGTLCFIEVKTWRSDEFGSPLLAVNLRKQRQIIRTARFYKRIFGLAGVSHRFDVVTIVKPEDAEPSIELHRAYWTDAKFAALRRWQEDQYRT